MPELSHWRPIAGAAGFAASILVAASAGDAGCAVFTDLGTDGYTNGEAGTGATRCDAEAGCAGASCKSASDCMGGDVCCFAPSSATLLACAPAVGCAAAVCSTNTDCGDGGTCIKQECSLLGPISACTLQPTCTPVP